MTPLLGRRRSRNPVMPREGVWRDNPDLIAFAKLAEELRARGPTVMPKGHRFGSGVGGGKAYYTL